jgi:hypothetical protein
MITFLMHQGFLQKLSESFMEAITNYHLCKEYYYIFKFNNKNNDFSKMRKYSAQDIMFLITETNNYFLKNSNFNIQLNYLKKFHFLDQVYYFYVRNKNFYIDFFKSMQDAKVAYFERRDYRYKFVAPNDFYNFTCSNTYSALELLEINAYVQYLVQRKIIKELPIPKYLDSNINTNTNKNNIEHQNINFDNESDIDTYVDENFEFDIYSNNDNLEEDLNDFPEYMPEQLSNNIDLECSLNDNLEDKLEHFSNNEINNQNLDHKYIIKKLERNEENIDNKIDNNNDNNNNNNNDNNNDNNDNNNIIKTIYYTI